MNRYASACRLDRMQAPISVNKSDKKYYVRIPIEDRRLNWQWDLRDYEQEANNKRLKELWKIKLRYTHDY
jgi:hypothetical protein